jgi:hypothetical protein
MNPSLTRDRRDRVLKSTAILLWLGLSSSGAIAEPVVDPIRDTRLFPVAVWAMPANTAPVFAQMGVNVFVAERDDARAWCDTLAASGVAGYVHWSSSRSDEQLRAIASSSGFLGWMHGDEPDNPAVVDGVFRDYRRAPQQLQSDYDNMLASSTPAPMYLNLGQGMANGMAQSTPDSIYPAFCSTADILCYDVYPTSTQADGTRRLHLVARGVERLRAFAGPEKPVWVWLECTNIHDGNSGIGNRSPHPHELRAEVWMAIVHGADGIGYFPHQFNPYRGGPTAISVPLQAEMSRTNGLLHSLAPLLRSQTRQQLSTSAVDGLVSAALWQTDGRRLLVAVNMRPDTAHAVVDVPDGAGDLAALGDARSQATDSGLNLHLRPYEAALFASGLEVDMNTSYDYPSPPMPLRPPPQSPLATRISDLPEIRPADVDLHWARTPKTRLLLPFIGKAPIVDGDLGDDVWRKARRLDAWTNADGTAGPDLPTESWIGIHGDRLYVAFRAAEPDLDSLVTHHKALWRNDCIELWFDPDNRRTSFAHIIITADGQVEAKRTIPDDWGEGLRDESWSPQIVAATGRAEGSWTVELSVTLADLGLGTGIFGFDLARERKTSGGENTVWTLGGFNKAQSFGELVPAPTAPTVGLANGQLHNLGGETAAAIVEILVSAPLQDWEPATWEEQWQDLARERLTVSVPAHGRVALLSAQLVRRVPAGGRVRLRLPGPGPEQFEEFIANDPGAGIEAQQ